MDHGTVPNYDTQRERHPQRSQRLGHRSGQSSLYPRFAVKYYQCECADGGDCEGIAGGEV